MIFVADLQAIAYSSQARQPMTDRELEDLLLAARERNSSLGVSGALLYQDERFFQYIEGPRRSLAAIYEIIRHSSQHVGVCELMREPAERRYFEGWNMGFARAPDSLILRLSQANWLGGLADQKKTSERSLGLNLLLRFWDRSQS